MNLRRLGDPFRLIWTHRLILWRVCWNDIRGRYAGSVLGLTWLVMYPLLFLGIYALIYGSVFRIRFNLGGTTEYIVFIFCGLIPFLGFSEALSSGVACVTANASLIKNTLFPIELIPVRAVLTSQCTQVVGTFLLLIAVAAVGHLTPWALLILLIWPLQIMFTIGLIWVLSSLNVYFRDLQNIVGVVILMLMMISPIAWSIEMVPEPLRPFMGINPLYYLLISYQECLMGAREGSVGGHFPRGSIFWGTLIMAPVMFFAGYWFFSRMKRLFADNV